MTTDQNKEDGNFVSAHKCSAQMPGGPVSYGSQYNFVDAKGRLVSCLMLTPAAPGSENFRLLETAARSIQIR